MRILWLDINSSYSHSSVALPAIHSQVCEREDWEWSVIRGTINDNPGTLAAAVAEQKPDIIAATFWLFTHKMQIEVLSRAVQLLDEVKVICGGPEFLGDNEDFLRSNSFVSAVLRGEGEISLPLYLEYINDESRWDKIEGLCWISGNDTLYHDNGTARVQNFAELKYPEESHFFSWDKPFVQLETTRGCFNSCAFCVSAGEKPVRYQSLEQVKSRLENIYSHGIKDVRVLDRTFNHDTARACQMLELFASYEGKMRFHLEIHPSLLSEDLKATLSSLPKGLLHLEAGIQSLDSLVLSKSGRKGSLQSSIEGLRFLCSLENVQTHADLIAGLPEYTYEMLCCDIIKLAETGVDELQIESLKVLPGTGMRHDAHLLNIRYSPLPPYEVLLTSAISAHQLTEAMHISRMVDLYYNSSAWQKVTRQLICQNAGFLTEFTGHLKEKMVLESPVSLERRGIILYEYCRNCHPEMLEQVSIAWIQAGFSLKKEPAGTVIKIKHLDTFLTEQSSELSIEYGQMLPSHRYYLYSSQNERIIWGYDSCTHYPSPVFKAHI